MPKHVEQGATAGGDLAGSTYPNPVVASLQGVVISGTPSSAQVLTATSPTAAHWAAPTGGGAVSSLTTSGTSGAATLSAGVLNIPNYANTTYTAGSGITLTGTTFSLTTPISLTTTGSGAATLASGVLNIPTPGSSFITSITTTGTSGAATVASGVLNIPQYSGGGGTYTAGAGLTLTGSAFSLTAPVSVANGGTGSTSQNFVDLSTAQTVGGAKTLSAQLNTVNIVPTTNTAYTLGSSSLYWSNLYATRLNVNSTAYLDGGTAGVVAVTGTLTAAVATGNAGFQLNTTTGLTSDSVYQVYNSRMRVGYKNGFIVIDDGRNTAGGTSDGATTNKAFSMWLSAQNTMLVNTTGLSLGVTAADTTLKAPTHTLTLNSTATGIALYNTTDQTTNYERVQQYWSGNTWIINSENGGTGVQRNIQINGAGGSLLLGSTSSITCSTGGAIDTFDILGTNTATSGTAVGIGIKPTINQTSTGGYTALLVNPTETSTGSGAKLLADFQVGGTSKFKVDNTGLLTAAVPIPITSGGTGAATLPTGLLKGAGTGAITAAVAGTDYALPNANTTGNAATATALIGTTEDTQGFTYPTFRQNLRATISPTSGELTLYCFTAGVSRAITKLGLSVGATAAAGVTYCALGLYTVNTTTGAMTLVASTPNTTTAAAAAYTPYQIGLTATYSLVAGTRYAVGFLMLATTMPVMNAAAGSDDYGNNNFISGVQNRLLGQITGETTLPATIADSAIGANGNAVHVLMIM